MSPSFDDPRYEKYSQRLARLRGVRKYVYRMDVLERTLSYEEVTEIFVRVNSLGAKLRGSDLAMAQITAKWKDSLKVFEAFQTRMHGQGVRPRPRYSRQNLIAFATGQSKFHTVGRLKLDDLKSAWQCAQEGFRYAINFLKSNAGIESIALLSSPYLLISLGYFGHHCNYGLNPKEAAELRYWLYAANAKGRYSRGSSETLLDQDLARIHDGKGVAGLLETLKQQFGRLDIQPGDLESRNARSAYFKTMFLAFREDGAKDWTSNLTISLSHGGKQHKLQFHHIFPRAKMRDLHKPAVVNDIANLAFIGGKTNRKISNKPPADYIPGIIEKHGKGILTAQCIPTKNGLLTIETYLDFLAERRKLISARLNKFLEDARQVEGIASSVKQEEAIKPPVQQAELSMFARIATDIICNNGGCEILRTCPKQVHFIPGSWAKVVPENGTAWTRLARPVSVKCWLELDDNTLSLKCEVSRMNDPALRLACVEGLRDAGFRLNSPAFREDATYSRFYRDSRTLHDFSNEEELRAGVEELFGKAREEFPKAEAVFQRVLAEKHTATIADDHQQRKPMTFERNHETKSSSSTRRTSRRP